MCRKPFVTMRPQSAPRRSRTAFVATVVNRWFVARRGLVSGILTAGNATGQLVFLPLVAWITTHHGWRTAALTTAAAALAGLVPAQFASNTTYEATLGRIGSLRRNTRHATWTGLVGALGLAAIGWPLLVIAYGREFEDSYWVLLATLPGIVAYGVLQVFTQDPPVSSTPRFGIGGGIGSDGQRQLDLSVGGGSETLGALLDVSRFRTDGYRDHSETERNLGNAKLTFRPDADNKWTLIANSLELPKAQDPLGLTRAQYEADPRGVDPSALDFDTRKTVHQTQLGVIYERRVDAANSLQAMVYGGHRGTEQYQSIPVATQQSSPRSHISASGMSSVSSR